MGFQEEARKKHQEAKPGRDIWNPESGDIRVIEVMEIREGIPINLPSGPTESTLIDFVDTETKEELSVWGYARLLNALSVGGVYVVEYNGLKEKGHSFWITDVTEEYNKAGKKEGKK